MPASALASRWQRVGLGDKIDTHPADLSGGQKQRVAIARALVGDPSIVLADEPTAALDSVSGRTVLELLRDLARDAGRAIVLVTHDTRAVAYADRIVSIEDGRLREGAHDPAALPPVALAASAHWEIAMQRRTLGLIILSAAVVTTTLLIVARPDHRRPRRRSRRRRGDDARARRRPRSSAPAGSSRSRRRSR